MNEGFQFLDIILLAMLAGFIALQLRRVLGRRTGEEPTHPRDDRLAGASGASHDPDESEEQPDSEAVVRLEEDPALRKAYGEIRHIAPDFDLDMFLSGSREVYSLVLEAFWRGDRDGLRQYLNDDVYAQFATTIDARAEAEYEVEGRVVDLTEMQVVEASVKATLVEITVRYRAEIVSVTRDKAGEHVEGNLSDTVGVTDIWTFERDFKSSDPGWTLIATRSD